MAMPSSGPISLNQANIELGRSNYATISMNDGELRTLAGVGSSGSWGMNSLYGKSAVSIGITGNFTQVAAGGFHSYKDRGVFSVYTTPVGQTITSYQWDFDDFGSRLTVIGSMTGASLTLEGPVYNSDNFPNNYDVLVKCTAIINGVSKYTEFSTTYRAEII